MCLDAAVVIASYSLMLSFRFQEHIPAVFGIHGSNYWVFMALAVASHVLLNWLFHVYSIVNRYVGLSQALWIVEASALTTALLLTVALLWPAGSHLMPLSVVILGGACALVSMVGLRFYSRVFQTHSLANVQADRRLLLVGAGRAADMILRGLDHERPPDMRVVGLVDDDPALRGRRLHNYKVLGTVDSVESLVAKHGVSDALIAIPSATAEELGRIHGLLRGTGARIRTVPTVSELIGGRVSIADARDINVEDLLGRPDLSASAPTLTDCLRGQRVAVTGAAGSIGAELCRQIVAARPELLLLIDRDESGLYRVHEDLRARGFVDYVIAPTNILQGRKLDSLFDRYSPNIVFHAAAFKHVSLMEQWPDEAVINNVKGTMLVARTAGRHAVRHFVNISTDKAADPISVMGATKHLGELAVQALAREYRGTQYCSVRFGNVLGSNGSMLPVFRQQIRSGGPVMITHPDMTRYVMSIAEAVHLLVQALSLTTDSGVDRASDIPAGGKNVYVLDMGEPVRIVDLATRLISFYCEPGSEVEIAYSGIRPGEKLEERLFGSDERAVPTRHPKILLACASPGELNAAIGRMQSAQLLQSIDSLVALAELHPHREEVVRRLADLIPSYHPFLLPPAVSPRADSPVSSESGLN